MLKKVMYKAFHHVDSSQGVLKHYYSKDISEKNNKSELCRDVGLVYQIFSKKSSFKVKAYGDSFR